eukprot:CFRG2649T1
MVGSYAPVPKSLAGYRWGSAYAPVQAEYFHDLQCPFSKKFFDTLHPLLSQPTPKDCKFSVTISLSVLFGHNQAFESTRGVIHAAKGETTQFIAACKTISDNFDQLKNDACVDKSRRDVEKIVAGILTPLTGETEEDFIINVYRKDDTYNDAKVMFRNQIIKQMFGTPSVRINDVAVSKIGSAMTLDEILDCFNEVADMTGPAKFL